MRVLASLVIAWLTWGSGIAGHQPQATSLEYREFVSAYRRADRQAIGRVLAIPASDVKSFVDQVVSGGPGDTFTWPDLRAAAILHTEAWQQQGGDAGDVHLAASLQLLEAVQRAAPSQWTFIERWQAVIGGIFLRRGDERGHRAFRDRLRTLLPLSKSREAAMAAVGRGVEAESQANAAGEPVAGRTISARAVDEQRTRGWSEAAAAYEAALSLEPGYRLASLRLGRIRVLQGRFADAMAPLQAARDDSDARVAYLALLYLGSVSERNQQFDEAERVYQEALRRYPHGQSAPLALAHLLTRTNRDGETIAVVKEMLSQERRVEPLWTLWMRPDRDLRDYALPLAELVAEVEGTVE